jgi:hypothetical protein
MAPTKETPQGGTATAEQEQPVAHPQTPEQIEATEKMIGIVKPGSATPTRVPVRMGVAPTNIEEGWRLAQFIAQSELVPKGYRGRPADVLVAIQYGMEVGLPPMAALHSIYVTNGRPNLWGDGFLAVIMASPRYKDHEEYFLVKGEKRELLVSSDLTDDNTTAVCTFWRTDNPRPRTSSFSIAKAKKAGLWTKEGPWQNYPDRMLKMRARGFAGHDAFPEVLRGMTIAEAAMDEPPIDITPEPVKEVRRVSETATAPKVEEPTSTELTVGPIGVRDVQQFLGGYCAILASGEQIEVESEVDAIELEKFKGSTHKVRLVCVKVTDGLRLRSFSIAD